MERELTIKEALNLAVEKHKNKDFSGAKEIYLKILDKVPGNSDALHLLGLVFHHESNYEKAIELVEKAISINPDAVYYGNLGMCYDALGKEGEANKFFIKALEINPEYTDAYLAHYNLGVSSEEEGEIEKALEHYDKSIELNQNFPESRWNRSLILLLLGKFEQGWKDYSYRFKKANPTDSRRFNKPEWDGSPLNGKKILIVSEQGFGDNIQFARYINLVRKKGGYVILEYRKELRELFENLPANEFVEKENISKIDYDFYIHIMDLPRVFNMNFSNIPCNIPYLKANPEKARRFAEKFKENKFKVGLVWAGNPKQDNDKNRSFTFKELKPLTEIGGIKFFSLQKGKEEKQDSSIVSLADEINDFSDTAAIIENLDLVISVDTSVAHLAGAMGKPVWTLLTFLPDWRWFLNRTDSPWYPEMRLFRQKKKGDWGSLVNEVKNELIKPFSH